MQSQFSGENDQPAPTVNQEAGARFAEELRKTFAVQREAAEEVLIPPEGYITRVVSFSPETFKVLQELSEDAGSLEGALRDAIALSKWFKDIQKDANLAVERNGKFRKVQKIRYRQSK